MGPEKSSRRKNPPVRLMFNSASCSQNYPYKIVLGSRVVLMEQFDRMQSRKETADRFSGHRKPEKIIKFCAETIHIDPDFGSQNCS